MAPLGWSGGSQFSSTVLPVGSPIMVSMRGGEGAVGLCRNEWCNICGIAGNYISIRCKACVVWHSDGREQTSYITLYIFAGRHTFIQINLGLNQAISKAQETKLFLLVGAYDLSRKLSQCVHAHPHYIM